MDSLRLCLSCAGRKPSGSSGSRNNKRSRHELPTASHGECAVRKGGSSSNKGCCYPVDSQLTDAPLSRQGSSIEERIEAKESSSVSDDSLEKILEHAAQDDQPDTPGYWRNRGIGDVDTPPIRRRGLLIPPPPLSCYSSSSNSVNFSVDSCTPFFFFLFHEE